jgi:hypothetical protein
MGSASFDCNILSAHASTNYATAFQWFVGEDNTAVEIARALIRCPDLHNLADVLDQYDLVTFYIFARLSSKLAANSRTFRVYRLLRDWDLTTATWNNYSTGNAWGTAGAGNTTTDYDGAAEVAATVFNTGDAVNTVKSFSMDPTIMTQMIDGTLPDYGWIIKADTELNDAYLMHSGNAASQNNAPIFYAVLRRK